MSEIQDLSKVCKIRLANFYEDKTVFITGGSGFLGQVLIEKLLNEFSNVKTIYLLMRNKKGKTPNERLTELFKNPLYEIIKKKDPRVLKKCKIIGGDVTEKDLGISPEDRKTLTTEVDYIYHSAATTRFDDSLKRAATINSRGTMYMLELAKECKNLELFVHVSTAYCQPREEVLYEKVYPFPGNPHDILEKIYQSDESDENYLKFEKETLGDCPNTYTFTKAISEALVAEQMEELPIVIVRPSVVVPTYQHPIPGWTSNLQGPLGLLVGAGKGIIRTMYMDKDTYADFIPVDFCILFTVYASWVYVTGNKKQRVFNLAMSDVCNVKWDDILTIGKEVVRNKAPFNVVLWYPGGIPTKSYVLYMIQFYLFQIIPALFVDGVLLVLGRKPILYQIQKRIQASSPLLTYYAWKNWKMSNKESLKLIEYLNEDEKARNPVIPDAETINEQMPRYFEDAVRYVKKNILHENQEMLPLARTNIKILWVVDSLVKLIFALAVLYYAYSLLSFVLLK